VALTRENSCWTCAHSHLERGCLASNSRCAGRQSRYEVVMWWSTTIAHARGQHFRMPRLDGQQTQTHGCPRYERDGSKR
jgi:hypothetical protein